jgi:hypothetical protein
MASNVDRNPLIQMCGRAQVINNTTYNAGGTFSHQQLNCRGTGYEGNSYTNWINNYHKKGPSGSDTDLKIIPVDDKSFCSTGKTYMSGNVGNNGDWTYEFKPPCVESNILTNTPASGPGVATTNAQDAYNNVLADGGAGNSRALNCNGAWYNRRDAIDARIIGDVKNGTGAIIDNPSQVGGWITPETGTSCVDGDKDGMPDTWESLYGFNPGSANDGGSSDADNDGYTNLEEYLNGTNPKDGLVIITPTPTATPIRTSTPVPTMTSTPTATPYVVPGDTNNDGNVDEVDYAVWLKYFNQSVSGGAKVGDFNADNKNNGVDYVIWLNNYGK